MKICGDKNLKRCVKVGEVMYSEFNDKNSAIGFIVEHGLLGEYISNMYDPDEIDMYIKTNPNSKKLQCIEYNGEKYWYGENSYDIYDFTYAKKVGFYRELPDIYDDERFHWKTNKKYGSQECVIVDKMFDFHCVYKADGNATIDVRYNVCDNRHRNKVTISTIEVEYASNELIDKAIRTWKIQFKNMMKNT